LRKEVIGMNKYMVFVFSSFVAAALLGNDAKTNELAPKDSDIFENLSEGYKKFEPVEEQPVEVEEPPLTPDDIETMKNVERPFGPPNDPKYNATDSQGDPEGLPPFLDR
jgi:hypothetical protein